MSTTPEPEYRLPLPTPAQAKSLAESVESAVSPDLIISFAELAAANASGNAASIDAAADAVIGKFEIQHEKVSTAESTCQRFSIYDAYFLVNRMPDGAPKRRALEALTIALAVVMKDAAKAEVEERGVTPIELGILRQALAVVIEVLTETATAHP